MDGTPYTGDLDLTSVSTRSELAARLRQVRVLADGPSLRDLEAMTRDGDTPLSKTVVAEMLGAKRFPRRAVMVAFLKACEIKAGEMESWVRAWERVASSEAKPHRQAVDAAAVDLTETDRLRDEISRLTVANERLSAQLAGKQRALDEFAHDEATGSPAKQSPLARGPMWHFPDGSRITLASHRLAQDRRPPSADPASLNYVRFAELADLDTLIDVHGAIRANNPTSQVVIMAAQKLIQRDVANHLVLIGGLAWKTVTPWFSRIFSIPIEPGDPADRGAIVVQDPDHGPYEFRHTLTDDELVEDIGFFARGENPSAPRRTLTICGGITTRGVYGAAQCFIDPEMMERNEQYVASRFPAGSTYCIVMRVPVVNTDPLTPDLSKRENRLYEWSDTPRGS